MVFVDTPIFGFAKTTQHDGGLGNRSIISPRPVTNAVWFITLKGTSEPTAKPRRDKSSSGICNDHNMFNPRNTAAALLLPPPRPADTGMSLSILICTPCLMPYVSLKSLAADRKSVVRERESEFMVVG